MMIFDKPTPCLDNWAPFEELIEHDRGQSPAWAITEVGRMCGSCPVRVECWTENKEEPWLQALRKRPIVKRDNCGTMAGARTHYRNKEATRGPCRAAEAERWRQRKSA